MIMNQLFFLKHIYILQTILLLLITSSNAENPDTSGIDNDKNTTCFSTKDTLAINTFFSRMDSLINNNDTAGILSHIQFPLNIDGEEVDKNNFMMSYYTQLIQYLLKNHMDKEEAESLERIEEFVEKETNPACFQYYISNSFSELEFSIDIYLDKINGIVKVISLSIIG